MFRQLDIYFYTKIIEQEKAVFKLILIQKPTWFSFDVYDNFFFR